MALLLTGKPVTIKLNEQKSIFFLFTYKTTDRGELFWKSVLLTPFNKICDRESLFLNSEPADARTVRPYSAAVRNRCLLGH